MLRRTCAALLAVWTTIVIVEPAAVHACAMHDGTAHHGAAGTAVVASDAEDAHDGHGAHGDSGTTGASHATETPADGDEQHTCSCLGECCAAVATPLPTGTWAEVVPAAVRRERPAPVVPVLARTTPGLRLPFATAPPILPATPS